MNLVYMRIATHIVANVRHIMLQARFAAVCVSGSVKFGWTPGGGFRPGPSSSWSNVAIAAYNQNIHVGRRIMREGQKKQRKCSMGAAGAMGNALK